MIFIRGVCIVSVLCINDMKQNPNAQCSIRGEHENIVLTQGRNVMVMMTYLCLFAEITFFHKYKHAPHCLHTMYRCKMKKKTRRNNKNNLISICECVEKYLSEPNVLIACVFFSFSSF